jgi:uncharacterized protein YbcV (DUF1398 family)
MFTAEQIKAAHAKTKTGADYPRFVQDAKKLGVHHYDYIVENGSTIWYDKDGNNITTLPNDSINRKVSDTSSSEMLKKYILQHQQGGSDYSTFCRQAAEVGVARWSSDLEKMVCSYYDKNNMEMYAEPIPEAKY